MKSSSSKKPGSNTLRLTRIQPTRRVNKVIEQIRKNPVFGLHIKVLHGRLKGKYSYRMGGWRIIYEVDINKKIVEIWYIETRGDVYKKR